MARKRDSQKDASNHKHLTRFEPICDDETFPIILGALPEISSAAQGTLKTRLPIICARYLRTRSSEIGSGLRDRRRQLDRIAKQASKLKDLLINFDGPGRLDFLTSLSSLTGSTFTIDSNRPDKWLKDSAIPIVRDLGVSAAKSSQQLKKYSVKGGRPKHAAERLLIWDLANLYKHCTNQMPGRRGYFPRFIRVVFQHLDQQQVNQGLDDLVSKIVTEFKLEFDENA